MKDVPSILPFLAHISGNSPLAWIDGSANSIVAGCYYVIGLLILQGLWRNRQVGIDLFASITCGIFLTCAFGHTFHTLDKLGLHHPQSLQVFFDALTVIPATAFLSMRNRYSLLIGSTQVLNSQKELECRNLELEQKVECRTQELAAQNLRLSDALTELKRMQLHLVQTEKITMLGQMVSGISHEINNPINFIHGNLPHVEGHIQELLTLLQVYQSNCSGKCVLGEAAIEEVELEFIVEDLPRIVSSMRLGTERIRELVLNLRNFYRLDEVEMKEADLHVGIDSTLVLLNNRYKQKIQIVRQYGTIPLVECHINQINQVFMNLLGNAIDALAESAQTAEKSGKGEKQRITIATEHVGDWVQIRITDNGDGIPLDAQLHLFEAFFTTKPRGVGTGLGLSISHQIVTEAHGGKISCHSIPGKGTTFTVELPLRQPQLSKREVLTVKHAFVSIFSSDIPSTVSVVAPGVIAPALLDSLA